MEEQTEEQEQVTSTGPLVSLYTNDPWWTERAVLVVRLVVRTFVDVEVISTVLMGRICR